MNNVALIGGAVIAFELYYLWSLQQTQGDASGSDAAATCPDGYTLSLDGTQCDLLASADDACPEGYTLSLDGTQCDPLSSAGACPEGYTLSLDGTQCDPPAGEESGLVCDDPIYSIVSPDGQSCYPNSCPSGWDLSADGSECLLSAANGACKEGLVLSADGLHCEFPPCPEGYMQDLTDPSGVCILIQPDASCPSGSTLALDGQSCIPNTNSLDMFPAMTLPSTGNETADAVLNGVTTTAVAIAIDRTVDSLVTNALEQGLETTGDKLAADAAAKAAAADAAKVAEKAASTAAEKAAAKAATEAAEKASQEAAQRLASDAAAKVAARAAAKSSLLAGKIGRAAAISAKLAAGASKVGLLKAVGVLDMFGLVISQILIATLGLHAEDFQDCKTGEWSFSQLPDWVNIIVGALPLAGTFIDLFGPVTCATNNCNPPFERQNDLCYAPPREGWECEAFLCYKRYPEWENNGQAHTMENMTKNTLLDTGQSVLAIGTCPPGQVRSGDLCYDAQPGYNVVAGVAWEACQEGERDDGAFCSRTTIDPCPDGSHDVGGSCWGVTGQVCADDCSKGWDSCKYRTDTYWSPGECASWGCEQCTSFGLLGTSCITNMACCNSWGVTRGGDCVGGCPTSCAPVESMTVGLADRNWSWSSRAKNSFVVPPHNMSCPDGYVDGAPWGTPSMCYTTNIPEGYRRVVAGTLIQDCPSDNGDSGDVGIIDMGAICQRARYDRGAGKPAFSVRIKDRPVPEAPEPFCKDLTGDGDPDNPQVCRKYDCPVNSTLDGSNLVCIAGCPTGWTNNGINCTSGNKTMALPNPIPVIFDTYPLDNPISTENYQDFMFDLEGGWTNGTYQIIFIAMTDSEKSPYYVAKDSTKAKLNAYKLTASDSGLDMTVQYTVVGDVFEVASDDSHPYSLTVRAGDVTASTDLFVITSPTEMIDANGETWTRNTSISL